MPFKSVCLALSFSEVTPTPEESCAAEKRITSAATIAGITVEFQTVQQSYTDTNRCLAKAARPNDIVIVSRSMNGFPLDRDLIEAMLFTSGRPVLVIPPNWEKGAEFQNIIIGWDGGARAPRAVGDAMPLLTRAEGVEIVCVVPDASKSVVGAYAHPKLLQMVRGGVTSGMLSEAELPVLLSDRINRKLYTCIKFPSLHFQWPH